MIKAVFIDYMGTTVDERSSEMAEIVRRICKRSGVPDPRQVQRFILDTRRRYEMGSYLDAYLTEDKIADRLVGDMPKLSPRSKLARSIIPSRTGSCCFTTIGRSPESTRRWGILRSRSTSPPQWKATPCRQDGETRSTISVQESDAS